MLKCLCTALMADRYVREAMTSTGAMNTACSQEVQPDRNPATGPWEK